MSAAAVQRVPSHTWYLPCFLQYRRGAPTTRSGVLPSAARYSLEAKLTEVLVEPRPTWPAAFVRPRTSIVDSSCSKLVGAASTAQTSNAVCTFASSSIGADASTCPPDRAPSRATSLAAAAAAATVIISFTAEAVLANELGPARLCGVCLAAGRVASAGVRGGESSASSASGRSRGAAAADAAPAASSALEAGAAAETGTLASHGARSAASICFHCSSSSVRSSEREHLGRSRESAGRIAST